MAGSLNKVQLIGNLGKDPEIRSLNSGDRVANFSIACSESWKDKSTGEKKERTEWVNVVVFGDGLVGVIEKYVTKGSKVYVEGALQTRKWQDKDGNDRWSTEVSLKPFNGQLILLGGKGEGGGERSSAGQTGAGGYSAAGSRANAGPEVDDEIPF